MLDAAEVPALSNASFASSSTPLALVFARNRSARKRPSPHAMAAARMCINRSWAFSLIYTSLSSRNRFSRINPLQVSPERASSNRPSMGMHQGNSFSSNARAGYHPARGTGVGKE